MTREQQKIMALKTKLRLEKRIRSMLAPWIRDIAATYRLGNRSISQDSIDDLRSILKRFYQESINLILGFDTRRYKADADLYESIAATLSRQLDRASYERLQSSTYEIARTTGSWASRVSSVAIANGWSEREAQQALISHMRAHSLTIAVSEAQWITETSRAAVVLTVSDPLRDSVLQVAELIRGGDRNAAVRLSRQVMKLARLPLSVSQGELVQEISDTGRYNLMTPLVQGEYLERLTARAEQMSAQRKTWEAIGDSKTRDSHMAADGQTVNVREPFRLEGGLLMWPGDGSLGADLSEIINCRCAASFS